MNLLEMYSAVEAILFTGADPVHGEKISDALELSADEFSRLMPSLLEHYNSEKRGLKIIRLANSYQLVTRCEYGEYVKLALDNKKTSPLSGAAKETLAIIAYNEPATKALVEQIRGVDSSSVVNNLVEKGLVEESGKLDAPGRPTLYKTTPEFLRIFSLSDLSELPPLPSVEEQAEKEQNFEGEI